MCRPRLVRTCPGADIDDGSGTGQRSFDRGGDPGIRAPEGVVERTVRKGIEPKSQTTLVFTGPARASREERFALEVLGQILEIRLRDELREELGGTYSVGVDYSNTLPQPGYGTTSIQFGSSPDRVDSLVATVMTELDRMRRDGPNADDVQKVKETEKEGLETSFKQNGFWLGAMQTAQMLGWDPVSIIHRTERTDTLTAENIHDAFRKYFPADRYTLLTLLPEKGTQ